MENGKLLPDCRKDKNNEKPIDKTAIKAKIKILYRFYPVQYRLLPPPDYEENLKSKEAEPNAKRELDIAEQPLNQRKHPCLLSFLPVAILFCFSSLPRHTAKTKQTRQRGSP